MNSQQPSDKQNSNDSDSSEGIRVPPAAFGQLEALRESGIVNMQTEIHVGLERFGFDEALKFIRLHPEMYVQGLRKGFTPTAPELVPEIDPATLRESVPTEHPEPTRADADTVNEQRLLDHLQSVRRISDRAEAYYTTGRWREVAPLTDEERELVGEFQRAVDCQPQKCYYNALLTAATFGENNDVRYVEGYVMIDPSTPPIEHAWVEVNEKVVELTFPEGPQMDSTVAYLGVEFSVSDVREQILEEGIANPLIE